MTLATTQQARALADGLCDPRLHSSRICFVDHRAHKDAAIPRISDRKSPSRCNEALGEGGMQVTAGALDDIDALDADALLASVGKRAVNQLGHDRIKVSSSHTVIDDHSGIATQL